MSAEAYETHTAYVMLLGEKAYKMKKPVRNSFLDFSTPELRRRACEREFQLNSRFAPDVYLGVADLSDPAGGPSEPVLEMRRLPDDARLSRLARNGASLTAQLKDVAMQISSAHFASTHSAEIDRQGSRSGVSARWAANVVEMANSPEPIVDAEILDEIDLRARRYVAGRGALFDLRIMQQHMVDGHGDLLSDDIFCLEDGARILDSLDFDDHLRYVDGVDDAACLTMDLQFQGRRDLAETFMSMYLEAARDEAPKSLQDCYIAYRALVRSKVACIRFEQGVADARTDARDHARLALEHLRTGAVKLALVGGLPGTGKTTVAHALAARVDAIVVSSDVVRKELHGLHPSTPQPSPIREGIYSASNTDHTYAELLRRARMQLIQGRSVVLDASWIDRSQRGRAALVAACTHSDLIEIECSVAQETALERIATRPHGASDADRDVFEALGADRDAWPTAVTVDTASDLDDTVDRAERAWRGSRGWTVP